MSIQKKLSSSLFWRSLNQGRTCWVEIHWQSPVISWITLFILCVAAIIYCAHLSVHHLSNTLTYLHKGVIIAGQTWHSARSVGRHFDFIVIAFVIPVASNWYYFRNLPLNHWQIHWTMLQFRVWKFTVTRDVTRACAVFLKWFLWFAMASIKISQASP